MNVTVNASTCAYDVEWTSGTVSLGSALAVLSVATVMGNIFVMAAIFMETHLRKLVHCFMY